MQNIKVKNVIISKQPKKSKNFEEFLKIVNEKNINIIVAKQSNKIYIEKDVFFYVLWPNSNNFIEENSLNNNSIVCKLYYKKFSCLFTGDIEEIAEKELLKQYKKEILKSNILKIAHHGSKTSSTQKFLESVNPELAVICVGKNNFGHPNLDVLTRLNNLKTKIYRTDVNGEVIIYVNKKGNFKVNTIIK